MVLHIVRVFFLLVVLAITISFAYQKEVTGSGTQFSTIFILVPAILALIVILLDMFWRRKRLHVLGGLFFGLLSGLVIAYTLTLVVDLVAQVLPSPPVVSNPGDTPFANNPEAITRFTQDQEAYLNYARYVKTLQLVKLLLGAAAVFLCVSFVLQTKDDFRFILPYVEFARQTKGSRPILLDTSAIIDGRIADIAETRILDGEMMVPRFILGELQTIADSADKLKRNRGRRGLDVLNRLQGSSKADISIVDPRVPAMDKEADADGRLLALAKHLDGRIVTNDYNLNKVAQLRGVEVININDLANALKTVVLPGEAMTVKVIKPGEEAGQGVGYLEDGTMVVVEQGREHIGKAVAITVTSVLQTSAGRMIFGRTDPDKTQASRDRRE